MLLPSPENHQPRRCYGLAARCASPSLDDP